MLLLATSFLGIWCRAKPARAKSGALIRNTQPAPAASITTPAYTPLFALAAGVVTDIGGVLSHGSIVAREYGLPAVMGTGDGKTVLTDGRRVLVDGDAGIVRADE